MQHRNLASERVRIGLTQQELADELGVSLKTIVKWESDISTMPNSMARKAADLFICSTDYLSDRCDERTIQHPLRLRHPEHDPLSNLV